MEIQSKKRILHGSSPSKLIEHYTETIGRHPQLPEWIISGAVVRMQEEQKLSVVFGMSCTFRCSHFSILIAERVSKVLGPMQIYGYKEAAIVMQCARRAQKSCGCYT